MDSRIPVTLITGFLGAGKTTLLGHLLREAPETRFVIVENEYGDVGVDGSILDRDQAAVYELNDGCVCCTVRQDLIDVFARIRQNPEPPEHVIIETTGLAQPAPVMRIFDRPEIRDGFRLDGVVTVVDAAYVTQSIHDDDACEEQITYADLIVLNKIDRVDAETLASVERDLRQLNPLANVIPAERARVAPPTVLQVGRLECELEAPTHQHHHEKEHEHDAAIGAVAVEAPGTVNLEALDLWLGRLVWEPGLDMLRMKGVIAVPEDDRRFVFNGVRASIDVYPGREWGEESRFCRVVFIGRGLDSGALQSEFEQCMQGI